MTTNLQKLTLFCTRHQEAFSRLRSDVEILCDQERHVVSENYLRQKWNYCCSCQTLFARSDGEPAMEKCLVCDREIVARYLCDGCETLSCETQSPPLKREFSLSPAGLPVPVCPCCLKAPAESAHEHRCTCLKATFKTARSTCPFCEDSLLVRQGISQSLPPAFRRPAAYYLDNFNGKAFRVGYSETRQNALAAKEDGRFWMTVFQDDYSYLVFPSISRMESAQSFPPLQKIFDCERPGAGELWVVAPAIALYDAASGDYTIAQKGKLEVQAMQSAASAAHALSTDPPPLPPVVMPPPIESPVINTESIPEVENRNASTPATTDLLSKAEKKNLNQMLILAGAGLVVLVIVIAVAVSSASSAKNQILTKIKQGQMVSPNGDSAYDLYLKSAFSDGEKAEISNIATPALENYGSGIITRIAKDSYEPTSAELNDLIRTYTWLDSLNPKSFYKSRKQYFQGWQYYQSKDYKNAGSEFTQAMNLDTSWALPVNKLAHVALRYKDYSAAMNWYQKASERDPNWIIPYLNLGMLAIGDESKDRNYALAEEAARKALRLDSNKASAYYILGRALEGQGRSCEALDAYQNAVQRASNTPSPGFNVSNVSRMAEQLERRGNCHPGD